MISGNNTIFDAPLRMIKAKAELIGSAFATKTGTSLYIDDATNCALPMTVKLESKNHVSYPYSDTTQTINGITFTDNGDGTITANGTATATATFYVQRRTDFPSLEEGEEYVLSGCPVGGGTYTYQVQIAQGNVYTTDIGNGKSFISREGIGNIVLKVISGATANNLVFKPQIEKGSTATEYTPFVDVNGTKHGKNLFNVATQLVGKWIILGSGAIGDYSIFNTSDYIAIPPNTTFIGNFIRHCAFYDADKNYVGDSGNVSTTTQRSFTMPANAHYMRFSYENSKTDGSNVQIELGTTVTEYEPYVEISNAMVTRYGKNLLNIYREIDTFPDWSGQRNFDFSKCYKNMSASNYSQNMNINNIVIENESVSFYNGGSGYGIAFPVKVIPNTTYSIDFNSNPTTEISISWYDENGNYISDTPFASSSKAMTFTTPKNCGIILVVLRGNKDATTVFSNIVLTKSNSTGEYEPYKEPITAVPDENGVVNGLTSLKPMTLLTDTGVTMTATYQVSSRDFSADNYLQSIVINRECENKFFGYGVSQKATIKVLDKEREIEVANDNFFGISFDDTYALPLFYPFEVKRDENTNNLTITAYDKLRAAAGLTFNDLGISSFTLGELAQVCAEKLGLMGVVLSAETDWEVSFPNGANFDGSETLREVLNDIAEATQTIYFINYENKLVFKRLDISGDAAYTIDKSKYFTLKSEDPKTLTSIVSATELGDNVEASVGSGAKQYVRDNAFWTYMDDIGTVVTEALEAVGGLTISPFDCTWRGNYLLEPGDKIKLIAKDDSEIIAYFLNDSMTYTGGLLQKTEWKFDEDNQTHTNPSNLGEALKQTFAKVDKANKQIDLVVSETENNSNNISALQLNTDSIAASVVSIKSDIDAVTEDIKSDISTLTEKVNAQVTAQDIQIEIQKELSNGTDKVVTKTGFVLDENGLNVSKTGSEMSTQISDDGMTVARNGETTLTANNLGVGATNLHATTYLIIGTNSRLENYKRVRTGCFFVGNLGGE